MSFIKVIAPCTYKKYCKYMCAGSSVGLATDYGLDGPGSNPVGDEIFRPSRPALGPTQPPVQWVPGLSRGKVRPERAADHSPPSSAAVVGEKSYTSTHPLGQTGPVTGSLYFLLQVNREKVAFTLRGFLRLRVVVSFTLQPPYVPCIHEGGPHNWPGYTSVKMIRSFFK
jgi:hypothetical protein